jgi:hypothetical protein
LRTNKTTDQQLLGNVNDDGTIQPHASLTTEDNNDPPLLYTILLPDEPASYHEAIKLTHKDKWDNAIQEEMRSLSENHMWDLVNLPKD